MKLKIAFVGAGPLSLLKAISIAKQNPKAEIVIYDMAEKPGGSWQTKRSPEGHEIECGCHIWSYVPSVYQFIQTHLGIVLKPMRPSPQFSGKQLRIPYSWHNTLKSYSVFGRYLLKLNWKAIRNLKNDPAINFKIFNKKNHYPEKGSGILVNQLVEKIKDFPAIQIQLNSTIDLINLQTKPSLSINGHLVEFDKIFLTSVSQIKKLTTSTEEYEITASPVKYIHFLISLNQPAKQKISYLRMTNHPVVHRITDISYQTHYKENLLLVGIHENAFNKMHETDIENKIHELLLKLKIITTVR
ncbi:MAG: NAD(P)/FAD-dependent oxidoreductase [Crocinitomicaceae bacterium]|nr:NAD(P)/FAD-dependent oxidoreductase [Crocinitomicaceae bacterium]